MPRAGDAGHSSEPTNSVQEAQRFLEAFAAPDEVVTFQTFDDSDKKRRDLARILHGTLGDAALWYDLEQLNKRDAGVFWTVNATDGKGRKEANITRVRAVFADGDGAPLAPVLACELPPTAVIESSPGRWHAYWKTLGVPLEAFEALQTAIAARFLSDTAIKDLPRVMRLPGFLHQKSDPFLVRVLELHPERVYTLEQVSAAFPAPSSEARASQTAPAVRAAPKQRGTNDGARLEPFVKKILDDECDAVRHAPEGTGNATINKAAFSLGTLVGAGALPESTARADLEDAVSSWAKPDPGAARTIRSGLEAGKLKPRDLSNVGQKRGRQGAGKFVPNKKTKPEKKPLELQETWGRFGIEGGRIVEVKKGKSAGGDDEEYTVPLCNFTAAITAETLRDDGSGAGQNLFTVAGALETGETLPTVDVPSAEYNGLNWVTKLWGARAVVETGQGTRDKLRVAIQTRDPHGLTSRTVYTHTGWRKLEAHGWAYLHAGGAIGATGSVPGLEIDLGNLERYRLPEPLQGEALRAAVRSSLDLLGLAPDAVTLPLWLSIWRAALGVTRFSVYLYGVTGEAKSGLAALMLSHFGHFTRHTLPGSWESTVTSLERLLFTLKDAPCVIDDFNPRGSQQEVKGLHSKADRVLRNQGNGSARQRSTWRNGVLETGASYTPRGLCIVTGEDIPAGQSLRARNLILEVSRGDVRKERFSAANQTAESGALAGCMAAFLQWLASDLETHQAALESRAAQLASSFTASHGRTTDAAADLMASLEVWRAFALETGCLTAPELEALTQRAQAALQAVCGAQAAHQAAADPVHRFLELLPALFSSGKAHLQDSRMGQEPSDPQRWGWRERTIGTGDHQRTEWQAQGSSIGWVNDDGAVMLEAQSAYAALQRLAGEQGDGFTKSAPALWKALGERGLIVKDGGQNTVKRRIMGDLTRVLCLQAHTLETSDKTQTPTLSHSRDFRDTAELSVSDDTEPVPATRGVPTNNQGRPQAELSRQNERLEDVPETQQGRKKVRDGLGTVLHGKESPVPEVPAVQNTPPTNFLEGEL